MSSNNIALTLRLPVELNQQLTKVAKTLGFTKTNLIRLAIHDYLDSENLEDLESILSEYNDTKYRMVLNVNAITLDILNKQSEKYNMSINKLLVYAAKKSLLHYSRLIKKLEL
ncbi:TPA: hypothetical protein O2E65_001545 [Listeria monocytogenes]|uniref:hypothetical protein n=1 Tax=Listeria monocytogenes TaxID=1639 RepID=UPI0010D12508|nr:hypothetical protein [Listeria monocytogenes]EAC7181331.1 hypothetical protein [Listeria monocytogenes]EAC8000081.1 hypothetical protein [Listeria monocytogenes]MBC6362295.1 hypothetical protein [Listeria monocytogenes]HCY9071804.1 hypothetical protein [Listeria monocytogenes]